MVNNYCEVLVSCFHCLRLYGFDPESREWRLAEHHSRAAAALRGLCPACHARCRNGIAASEKAFLRIQLADRAGCFEAVMDNKRPPGVIFRDRLTLLAHVRTWYEGPAWADKPGHMDLLTYLEAVAGYPGLPGIHDIDVSWALRQVAGPA